MNSAKKKDTERENEAFLIQCTGGGGGQSQGHVEYWKSSAKLKK